MLFSLLVALLATAMPATLVFAAGAGTISGTATAADAPLSGVGVRLYREESGSWVWWDYVESTASGEYAFTGVPDGTYVAAFTKSAGWASEYFDDVATLEKAARLTISGATMLSGKDVVMKAAGAFSGRVLDPESALVSGARIKPYRQAPGGSWEPNNGAVRTTVDGAYSLIGLLPGTYRLEVSDPLGRFATRWVGGGTTLETAALQVCSAGALTPLGDLTLPSAGAIVGSVEHAYYVGGDFRVTAYVASGDSWRPVQTTACDSGGQFRLPVEPATYRLRVTDEWGTYASGWWTASGQLVSRADEGGDLVVSASVDTNAGQTWMGVAGTAYGAVVDGEGTGLVGVRAIYEQLIYKPALGTAEWTTVREATTGIGGAWELDDLIRGVSARVTFDPTAYNSANSTDLASYTWVHPVSGNVVIPYNASGLARMDATLTPAPDTRAPVTTAVLDPNPWRWTKVPVTVTLSADDPPDVNGIARGVRETRWSTREDAGPISAEQIYGAPIVVDHPGLTALYYRSIDNAGNEESSFVVDSMKSVSVYYDPNPPVTTPHVSPIYTNSAFFVVAFADTLSGWGSVMTNLDNAGWVSGQMVSTNVPGDHTLQYYGIDAVGNVEDARTVNFTVASIGGDTAPPTTTISNPATVNGWVPSPAGIDEATSLTVSLWADDGGESGVAQSLFTVDGGDPEVYNTTDRICLTQGEHTITYWSTDVAGNSEVAQTKVVRFDGTYPAATADIPDSPKDSATVTITQSDPYSGVGTIYYNLDGAGPVSVAETETVLDVTGYGLHTLSYFAEDAAGNGDPAFGPFTFTQFEIGYSDSVAPQTTLSGLPGGWTNEAVTLSLTATDSAGLGESASGVSAMKINTWGYAQDYTEPVAISGFGTTTVEYFSEDAAGNVEETRTALVRIDYEKPSTYGDVVVGPYAGSFVYPITATDDLSGIAATYWRIDGGPWQEGALAWCDEPGVHYLDYYSVDRAGNSNADYFLGTDFQVLWPDVTAPTVNDYVYEPSGSNGWNWYDIDGSLQAIDPVVADHYTSGIAEFAWRVGLSAEQTSTGDASVHITDEGTTTVTYRATDKTGRETTGSVTCLIDKSSPNVWAGATTYGDGFSELPLTADDAVSGIDVVYWRYGADMESLGTTQTGTTVRIEEPGTWWVEYWTVDRAGLGGGSRTHHTLTVTGGSGGTDTIPPFTTPVTTPSSALTGWSRESTVTVALSATDDGDPPSGVAGTYYRRNGGGQQSYDATIVVTAEGTTTISYWSVDNGENTETSDDVVVRLDRSRPSMWSDVQETYEGSAPISFNASDSPSGVAMLRYRVDGGGWNTGSAVTVTGTGSHYVDFYAEDVAGNASITQRKYFDVVGAPILDTLPPVTTVHGVPSGWARTDVALTFSAIDAAPAGAVLAGVAGTRAAVLPAAEATVTGTFTVTGEGTKTVRYRSVDTRGNWETLRPATVRIDRTAPVTTHNGVSTYSGTALITLTPNDGLLSGVASTQWRIDAGPPTLGTSAPCATPGAHTLWFSSTDNAGNVETEKSFSFTIQPPVVPPDPPAPPAARPAAVTLTASNAAPAYAAAVTLGAAVTDGGTPVPGAQVVFERFDGLSWVSAGEMGVTGPTGTAALSVTPYANAKTVYRARVLPSVTHVPEAEASASVEVKPKASVSKPSLSVTYPKRNRSFSVRGYLKPKHKSGSKSVVLRFYRKSGRAWSLKKTISAVNRDYSSYTKYSVSTSLSSTGAWKVIASHSDAAHAKTSSSARFFTVK